MATDTTAQKLAVGAALFLFGALMTHLWNKFRSRMALLSWTAESIRLALSAEDTKYGNVQVLYNGKPVRNLHLLAVTLRNESTRDLENVQVDFAFLDNTRILISEGAVLGSLKELLIDQKFMDDWMAAVNTNATVAQYYFTHREYPVAILNRESVARFGFLVTRDDDLTPTITVAVQHAGVTIKNRPPAPLFLGVPYRAAQGVGFLISASTTIAVAATAWPFWVIAAASYLVGFLSNLIGAIAARFLRGVVRVLS